MTYDELRIAIHKIELKLSREHSQEKCDAMEAKLIELRAQIIETPHQRILRGTR